MKKENLEGIVNTNEEKLHPKLIELNDDREYDEENILLTIFKTLNNKWKRKYFGTIKKENILLLLNFIKRLEDTTYKAGHSEKVLKVVEMIVPELKLSSDSWKKLTIASKFHDIGEFFLPSNILSKRIYDNETSKIYGLHSKLGAEYLRKQKMHEEICKLIKNHHKSNEHNNKALHLLNFAEIYIGLTSERQDRFRIKNYETIEKKIEESIRRKELNPMTKSFLEIIKQKHENRELPLIHKRELENTIEQELINLELSIEDSLGDVAASSNIKETLKGIFSIFNKKDLIRRFIQISLRSRKKERFEFDIDGKYLFQYFILPFDDREKESNEKFLISMEKLIKNFKNEYTILFKRNTNAEGRKKRICFLTESREEDYVKKGLINSGYFERIREQTKEMGESISGNITRMVLGLYDNKGNLFGYLRGPPTEPPENPIKIKEIEKICEITEKVILKSEEINTVLRYRRIFRENTNLLESKLNNITLDDLEYKTKKKVLTYMSDYRNSSKLQSTIGSEETNNLLSDLAGIQKKILIDNGLFYDKSVGDGVIAFGGIIPKSGYQLDKYIIGAIKASDEIFQEVSTYLQEKSEQLSEKRKETIILPKLAIGLTIGSARVGLFGVKGSTEYTATGTSTNKAARLVTSINKGEIWCDEKIHKKIKELTKENKLKNYHTELINKNITKNIKDLGNKQYYKIIKCKQ